MFERDSLYGSTSSSEPVYFLTYISKRQSHEERESARMSPNKRDANLGDERVHHASERSELSKVRQLADGFGDHGNVGRRVVAFQQVGDVDR